MTDIITPNKPELRYSTGPDGKIHIHPIEMSENCEATLRAPARDLASRLLYTYSSSLIDLLNNRDIPQAPSEKISKWLIDRAMFSPSVSMMSGREFNQAFQDFFDDESYPPEMSEANADSIVLNFQLPKPVSQFYKRSEKGPDGTPLPVSFGSMYRQLTSVPWFTMKEWSDENPNLTLKRLNEHGFHKNGADGFYYLFEIVERHGHI